MDKEILDKAQYSTDQIQEIEEGQEKGLDVSYYENPEFLAIQMREIRLGMMDDLPVELYSSLMNTAYFRRKYPPEVRNNNPVYLKLEDSIYAKDREIDKLYKRQEDLQKERDRAVSVFRNV